MLTEYQQGAQFEPGQTRRPRGLLPLTVDAQTGNLQLAMPMWADVAGSVMPGAVGSAMAPLRMAAEEASAARATLRAAEPEMVASRSGPRYDPPERPPRPFEADYRPEKWPEPHAYARPDGRLIDPSARVVGRRVVGGKDEAFPSAELDSLAEKVTGRVPEVVSAGHARRPEFENNGWLGLTISNRETGLPEGIFLHDDLPVGAAGLILRHELGHGIDFRATKGGLPVAPSQEAPLRRIYNDTNNPNPAHRQIEAWRGPTKPLPENVVSPETRNYAPHQIDAELWADAIRAYMADPNYLKTVAPDVAKSIRDAWNSKPELARRTGAGDGSTFRIAPRHQNVMRRRAAIALRTSPIVVSDMRHPSPAANDRTPSSPDR